MTKSSGAIHDQYLALFAKLSGELTSLGFVSGKREEFLRFRGEVVQRCAVSLREPRDSNEGYVEVFPGFNFAEVEALAARIQGKKPRSEFITCSLNIGLLASSGAAVEWPLSAESTANLIFPSIERAVKEAAVPFWEAFLSLENLLASFEAGDFRLCRGAEWKWRHVAVLCLLNQTDRAVELLRERVSASTTQLRPTLEAALERMVHLAL